MAIPQLPDPVCHILANQVQVFIAEGRVGQTCRLITDSPYSPCKRRRALSTGKQQSARSLSPFLRRVGGGYDYIFPKIPLGDDVFYNISGRSSRDGHRALKSSCADIAKQPGGELFFQNNTPALTPFPCTGIVLVHYLSSSHLAWRHWDECMISTKYFSRASHKILWRCWTVFIFPRAK